jgi:broad specificity phosphatase PhoE
MYVTIRHACDSCSQNQLKDFRDDPSICSNPKHNDRDIEKLVHTLVKDENLAPDILYTSPFIRTQQTTTQILKYLKKRPKIYIDTQLSRYFSEKEKKNPQIQSSTSHFPIPIDETRGEFHRRIKKHIRKIRRKHKTKIIWAITHCFVLNKIAYFYDEPKQHSIEPLEYFIYPLSA